jgi:protoporphyrinogen oxidase
MNERTLDQERRIVIIGAGPTGLAAGYRLKELGFHNFVIHEARDKVGGLAASETSANGFIYDIGGHVLFSHYEYFDRLLDKLIGSNHQQLRRDAWVWMFDRFVPYPFQNNIKYLPPPVALECVLGLIEAQRQPAAVATYATFEEFIHGVFGAGIAKYFLMPYNFKVWAHAPAIMNKEWVPERVSVVDVEHVLGNLILDRDDVGWGPNATFKYPRSGGTGGLFDRMSRFVEDHLRLNSALAFVDSTSNDVVFADGTRESYDLLLSTMPLDRLIQSMNGEVPDGVRAHASQLRHSGSLVVGVGIRQPAPSTKCWIYFPEDNCPFYRVTYLSNYSPDVVPDVNTHYSLVAEISTSEFKREDPACIVERTVQGLVNTKMISERDRAEIVDTHVIERDYTYPIPCLNRDKALAAIHPFLESKNIYSRGRFGAWRYEVGNMDHSVAQGVEWVNRIVNGDVFDEQTYLGRRGC